jgi:hypothetical protein
LVILFLLENQITIYKEDECVLANNSHRAKWKVISPTGNEAMVPSVCFSVPPPNKDAVDFANRFVHITQKHGAGLGAFWRLKKQSILRHGSPGEGSRTSKRWTSHKKNVCMSGNTTVEPMCNSYMVIKKKKKLCVACFQKE